MANKIWDKNIKALEKKISGSVEILQASVETENTESCSIIEIETEKSFSGEIVSIIKKGEKRYYLSGKYCPEGMAEFYAKKASAVEYGGVIYVIGFSDGRVLRHILKTVEKDVTVIVYEPSYEIFLHVMQNYNVTDILQNKALHIFVESINGNELKSLLPHFIRIDNITRVVHYTAENYETIFPEEVKKAMLALSKCMQNMRTNWYTMMSFSEDTIKNEIQNYKYLYDHYSITELCNKLPEGVPVIVVAAGPSLNKNIEMLRRAKGKACIIACDTALKPLLKRDIIPDFFVVVDPRKPIELFEEPRIRDIPMISGINIPVNVMQMHVGEKIIYFDTPFEAELLKNVFGESVLEHTMDVVPTGGSVATSAFSVGRMFGAKTIILMGQDLAYSYGKRHVEGAFKASQDADLKKQDYIMLEGIDGEMLPTIFNLKMYLQWFEEQIQDYSELTVVDATEGGALIHGSKVMTLEDAIASYCTGTFYAEEWLAGMSKHFSEAEKKKALEFFAGIPKHLYEVKTKIHKEKECYGKIEEWSKKGKYSVSELKRTLKKIKKLNKELDCDSLVDLIMDGKRKEEFMIRVRINTFEDDGKDNLLVSAQMGKVYLNELEKQIDDVIPAFEELSKFNGTY